MLRILAVLFGIFFITTGTLGFLPSYVVEGKLFNFFQVNFEHNVAFIAAGVLGLLSGLASGFASKIYFIVFGIITAILAIFGFMLGEGMLFDMIAINMMDNYFHAFIAAISLIIGITLKY